MEWQRDDVRTVRPLGLMGGFQAFGGGIGFILGTPSLWIYALVPIVLVGILFGGLGFAGLWYAGWASESLFGSDASGLAWMGYWTLRILLSITALLLALLLAFSFAQPLSGFALERIVLEQERALTGWISEAVPLSQAIWISCKVAFVSILFSITSVVGIFLLELFFAPAALVTIPLRFLLAAWLLAWNFLDYPLTMRGYGLRGRFRWFADHFDAVTTFGLGWVALLIVPGSFLLFLPMGVAGATQLVVRSEDQGQ